MKLSWPDPSKAAAGYAIKLGLSIGKKHGKTEGA
jgi:hypothetical protein